MSGTLKRIKVEMLVPHPDNPRISTREVVVDSIAAQLKESGRFSDMHSLVVRQIEGKKYQILSGHTRTEAAKKAGIDEVPCWVVELDDSEAHMLLVTCNSQGELDPLEIGRHALKAIRKGKGGRGNKKGPRDAYAISMGISSGYVSQLVRAAEVLEKVFSQLNSLFQLKSFLGRSQHLYAIGDADERVWSGLCKWLIEREWSVSDTKYWLDRVNEFDKPEDWKGRFHYQWDAVFLDYASVIDRFLDTKEFSPATVSALAKQADKTVDLIRSQEGKVDVEYYEEIYCDWLAANAGRDSWDIRKLLVYHATLETEFGGTKEDAWLRGDWREHLPKLPNASVSVLLADPPYGMDYQSDYRLDRRTERKHEAIANDKESALAEITEMLEAIEPKLQDDCHLFIFCHWSNEPQVRGTIEDVGYKIRGSLVWVKNNTGMGDPKTTFAPKHERIIHAVKGSPYLSEREADVLLADRVSSENHPTEKPVSLLRRLIEITTVEGQLVADPFGGIASTMIAAKLSERHYWGCEINEGYWEFGKARIEQCQPKATVPA